MTACQATIEKVARDSHGRLVAYLAARSGDVAGAEDALGDAILAALQSWPAEGIPFKPEAWLLTVARRRLIDHSRKLAVRERSAEQLQLASDHFESDTPDEIPDERLRLLFVCAHPAIDPGIRTPLMLQTVLGLDAARIASAFLTSPTTMSQRLVRAKSKIREAGIPFSIPDKTGLPERLQSVLEAIYAAFTCGWEDVGALADEAISLARVVCQLLPNEPEALGLLALVLHCHSRRAARFSETGRYIPLPEQDVQLWSREMIDEAESLLFQAAAGKKPGRFQLEAAIQSVHAQRRHSAATQWKAIARLYHALLHVSPTIGARLGQAIAVAQEAGPGQGLALLDQMSEATIQNHQPYWAARAHLLRESGDFAAAQSAYQRAIGLCENPAQRQFLLAQIEQLPLFPDAL